MKRFASLAAVSNALGFVATLAVSAAVVHGQEQKAEPQKKPAPATVIDASKYPSLQAAFDAVPEAGGLVRLPPGDFEITQPLVLTRGNTRVEGAGTATCIINLNQEGEPSLVIRSPEFEKNPRARLWRVQLADFRVTGDPGAPNNKSTQPKSGDGILAQGIDEIYIHGMTVDHHGGHGVHLFHCVEDPRVADSVITYNAQAGLMIVGGHDIVVNANHFEENQDAVRCFDSFNLCMNGNNLDDHLGNGVIIENTYGSVLSGNMIEECNGVAVILDRDCYGITISANVIAHNMQGGVELRDAWGCAVSANTFTIVGIRALYVGPAAGRITVSANNFSSSFIGEKPKREEDMAAGIVLEGASDVVIAGNIFSGLTTQAVAADAQSKRIVFTGNLVRDVNRKADGKRPPLGLDAAGETLIEGNLLEQAGSR